MKSNESVGQNLSQQLVYYLMAQIEQNIRDLAATLLMIHYRAQPSNALPKIDCGLYGLL